MGSLPGVGGFTPSDSRVEFDKTEKATLMSTGFYSPCPQASREDFLACKARAKATAERFVREQQDYAPEFVAHVRVETTPVQCFIREAWKVPGTPHYIDRDGDIYRIVTLPGDKRRVDLMYWTTAETGSPAFRTLMDCLDDVPLAS